MFTALRIRWNARRPRGFRTTYSVTTEESAAEGDLAESGWEDESGESVLPDKYDIADGMSVVDMAVRWLNDHYASQYSTGGSSGKNYATPHDWWSTDYDTDYMTGEETQYSFHPYGFNQHELERIYAAWAGLDECNECAGAGEYNGLTHSGTCPVCKGSGKVK